MSCTPRVLSLVTTPAPSYTACMLTCRARNVEPYAYLLHILTELPRRKPGDDVADLLPFNYAKA
jgi:hypothetical protein